MDLSVHDGRRARKVKRAQNRAVAAGTSDRIEFPSDRPIDRIRTPVVGRTNRRTTRRERKRIRTGNALFRRVFASRRPSRARRVPGKEGTRNAFARRRLFRRIDPIDRTRRRPSRRPCRRPPPAGVRANEQNSCTKNRVVAGVASVIVARAYLERRAFRDVTSGRECGAGRRPKIRPR